MSVLCPSLCELRDSKSSASTFKWVLDSKQYETPSGCPAKAGAGEAWVDRSSRKNQGWAFGKYQTLLGIPCKVRVQLCSSACRLPVVPAPLLKTLLPLPKGSGTFVKNQLAVDMWA